MKGPCPCPPPIHCLCHTLWQEYMMPHISRNFRSLLKLMNSILSQIYFCLGHKKLIFNTWYTSVIVWFWLIRHSISKRVLKTNCCAESKRVENFLAYKKLKKLWRGCRVCWVHEEFDFWSIGSVDHSRFSCRRLWKKSVSLEILA